MEVASVVLVLVLVLAATVTMSAAAAAEEEEEAYHPVETLMNRWRSLWRDVLSWAGT